MFFFDFRDTRRWGNLSRRCSGYRIFLFLLDCLIAFFVIGPLVIIFWRSVWVATDTLKFGRRGEEESKRRIDETDVENAKAYYSPIYSDENYNETSKSPDEKHQVITKQICNYYSISTNNPLVNKNNNIILYAARCLNNTLRGEMSSSLKNSSNSTESEQTNTLFQLNLGLYLMGSLISFLAVYGQFKLNDIMSPYTVLSFPVKHQIQSRSSTNNNINETDGITTLNFKQIAADDSRDNMAFELNDSPVGQYSAPPPRRLNLNNTNDDGGSKESFSSTKIKRRQLSAEKRLSSWWKRHLLFPVYAYILTVMVIFQWCGLWHLLNILVVATGLNSKFSSTIKSLFLFLTGLLILTGTCSLNNCIPAPLNIACDWNVNNDIYLIPTYFKIKPKDAAPFWKFLIDCFVTVYVFETAIICVWNGGWNLAQNMGNILGEPASWWAIFYFASTCLPAVIAIKSFFHYKFPCLCFKHNKCELASSQLLISSSSGAKVEKDLKTVESFQNGKIEGLKAKNAFPVSSSTSHKTYQKESQISNGRSNETHHDQHLKTKVFALNITRFLVRYIILLIGFIGVLTYWIGIWLLLDYYVKFEHLILLHWLSFLCLKFMFCSNSLIFRGILKDEDYFALYYHGNNSRGKKGYRDGCLCIDKGEKPAVILPLGKILNQMNEEAQEEEGAGRLQRNLIITKKAVATEKQQNTRSEKLSNKWLIPRYFTQMPCCLVDDETFI